MTMLGTPDGAGPDAIYVRLPNWVGDTCMCLPALDLLQRSRLPLVLCGRPWAQDLLAGLDAAQFIAVGQGTRADLAQLKSVRPPGRHALGLVFTNSFSSALMFRMAGIKAAGYRGDGRSLLLKWPLAKPADCHEVVVFYELARQAMQRWEMGDGLPEAPPSRLHLPITVQHIDRAERALAQAGIATPFVLLSPTATGLHHGKPKAWPQFGDLAQALKQRGWLCVVCPPAHEADAARQAVPSALVLPPLPLGPFAALTRRAALLVCNDSGTSHVGAAAGARQITLFGVTRRERTGPWTSHMSNYGGNGGASNAVNLGSENGWPPLEQVEQAALAILARPA